MIAAAALAAVALAAAPPDPCAPVPPEATPDPAAAALYRAVGDEQRRAGSADTATAAYRDALARDPSDGRSRAALAALCEAAKHEGAFQRGLARMESGDRPGAIAAFEEARAAGPDASAALLEGICWYELGDDGRARPLLAEAEGDPAHRESARFFLGLVALRGGRSREAAALLASSATDRRLGPMAMDLARLARREGRVVLSVLLDGGWDSNVDLTPDLAGQPASAGDTSTGVTALARVAPGGDTGPYLTATATWRNQARYDALDVLGGGVFAGWQAGHAGRYLLGEAGWEYRALGGEPYLSAPRLLGTARLDLGDAASGGVTYLARWERFLPAYFARYDAAEPGADVGYSGLRHFAEADVTWDLARARSSATVAWHGGWDAAHDPALAWGEHGPRAALRLALSRDVRLGLDAAFTWRAYQAFDPALGALRADRYLDAAAVLERDLGDRWTLRASLVARKAFSNVPDFAYTRIVPTLGIAWTAGLL